MEGWSMNPGFSDHCPLSVNFDTRSQACGKPFKFLNCLASLNSFEETVQHNWRSRNGRHTMLTMENKLKKLKVALKLMNKEEFSGIDNKIQDARWRLENLQSQMSIPGQDIEQVELERATKLELEKWSQQLQLIRPVSREEVKQALMGIDDKKAPGCDGYNSCFFKKTWHIVGEEVTAAVQEFFESADMCKAINCTTITLILKVQNLTNIRDFRPISYCTVLYKLISNVITTRMQGVMEDLVDNCQAAFVLGRLIIDNILMSHELVKGCGRENISPRCMLKIDMQKAYDSVEWLYLGVPLSTKRLSTIQCEPLIEKMLNMIQSWTTKFLLYADRAVLVKSVLFATQTFWAQIFMLPKKVIQFIETMCRRFLWTGNAEPIRKALIAWEKLCSPKVAGGLNFIDVELWNEVAICKLLWNIYTRKEKLWIHWVHTYYIKGHTVWSTEPKSASWAIQKIFQAKEYFAKPGLNEEDVQRMRLATKERLARWGVVTDQTCSLCNKEIETVQHMFFKCEITGKIWNGLLSWQGIQRTQHAWQEEITWLAKVTKGKSARAAICRMTLAAAVYHCWQ
ncbi:uncharacterized protein [Nicotiana sylvestris]|uniref:uncharacterized protein n=1 Tax=Nicotiana sylvestris TaxID=4096 RepID=UPI00388C73D2